MLPSPTLAFTASDWDVAKELTIKTLDDGVFFAKEAVSYTCRVTHSVVSSDDVPFLGGTLLLNVISTGCGEGEFLGAFDRGVNETTCVCSSNYFLPPGSECAPCPGTESTCPDIGMTFPHTSENHWRNDPTSHDIVRQPFFACPYTDACVGGNSTKGRCAAGYDDESPVCAVCEPGYVLTGDACTPCPGAGRGASGALIGVTAGFVALMFIGFQVYLCRAALTRADKARVLTLINDVGPSKLFRRMLEIQGNGSVEIGLEAFTATMAELRAGLSEVQLHQVYALIDADGSGGIDRDELVKFAKRRRGSVMGMAQAIKDDAEDKAEKVAETEARTAQRGAATNVSFRVSAKLASSRAVGGIFMKIKLIMGFGQVLSYYPVTFDTIQWPVSLKSFLKFFEIFSVDIFSLFGASSCQLETDALTKFGFHMCLVPGMLILLVCAFVPAHLTAGGKSKKYTRDSVKTGLFTLLSLSLYTVYVGVATRVFRLFKCRKIGPLGEEKWYLTSDYSVVCFEGAWTQTAGVAYAAMVLFVFGIPLFQFMVLFLNRRWIDEKKCDTPDKLKKHLHAKLKYGSLFEACKFF